MGFLTALFGTTKRSDFPPPRRAYVDEDDDEIFVALDALDEDDDPNADLVSSVGGECLSGLLHGVPLVGSIVHALHLVGELVDGVQPRPAPQAISDAQKVYRQNAQRTRLGDRPGVWVKLPRAVKRQAVEEHVSAPPPVETPKRYSIFTIPPPRPRGMQRRPTYR